VSSVITAIVAVGLLGTTQALASDVTPPTPALDPMTAWALLGSGVAAVITLAIASRMGLFDRDALDRGRSKAVRALPSPFWLVAWFGPPLAQGLAVAGAGAMGLAGNPDSFEATAQIAVLGGLVGSTVAITLALVANRRAPGAGLAPGWGDMPRGLIGFGLLIPTIAFVSIAAAEAGTMIVGPSDGAAHDTLRVIVDERANPWAWGLIAAAVIGAPIIEEIAYRGFMQSALLAATRRPWVSILVTAFVFALMHWTALPADGKHAIVPLFCLGVGLGFAVERTKRVWPAIVIHALFNAANVGLALAVG